MRRYAVVGDPVAHSKSPAMHMAAYRSLGIEASYVAMRVPAGSFGTVVDELRHGELTGVNITMPLKDEGFRAADELDVAAKACRSVNTMIVDGGRLVGSNTDIDGVAYALARLPGLEAAPILVLGAGGAARAAVVAAGDREVFVAARDTSRAERMLEDLGRDAVVVPWAVGVQQAIVVNATPIGMRGGVLPPEVLMDAAGLVDMPYGDRPTPAVLEVEARGIAVADGLDMLVGQAIAAFERFIGTPGPADIMDAAARAGRPRPYRNRP